ncbi:hypothetical protein ACK3TF_004048 [Chlorella vulgaris]
MTELRELKSSSGRLGLLLSLAFVTSVLVLTGRIGAGREAADVLKRAMYGFDSEQQVYAAPAESDQCTRAGAAAALYEGGWQELTVPKCDESTPLMASCTARLGHQWLWSQQVCSARHHNVTALRAALRRKRVHFLGDSHSRNCYTWLKLHLEGKLDAEAETVLPHTHADIYWHGVASTGETAADYLKGDLHLTMHWLPAVSELMARIKELEAHPLGLPDVMVISTSSWNYVLKKTLQDLQDELEQLRKLVFAADAGARKSGRHVLWMLVTAPQQVRGRSWSSTWHAPIGIVPLYNKALLASGMLHPQGPMLLLDLDSLTKSCLQWCSADGLHANSAVYALSHQIIVNLLGLPAQSSGRLNSTRE